MSSSQSEHRPTHPEEGDYMINWNISYVSSLLRQAESNLHTFEDQIKSELLKIKADSAFIEHNLSGPHHHLARMRAMSHDLKRVLERMRELEDLCRNLAHRTDKRIIL